MSGHTSDTSDIDTSAEDRPRRRFGVNASTDADSDERYCPDGPRKQINWHVCSLQTRKRARTRQRRPVALRPQEMDRDRELGSVPNKSIYLVPLEIWVKIFRYVLGTEPAVPFVYRLASVLPSWQYLAPFLLFQKVDLSASCLKETQKWLNSGQISQCREINLSGLSGQVIRQAATALRDHCPHLEKVHLSNCDHQEDNLKILAEGCQKIGHLDISFSQQSRQTLTLFFQKAGSSLKVLKMAGISVLPPLSCLANCPQLEVLDLRDSTVHSLNVDRLQQYCPALRVLQLSDAIVVSRQGTVPPQAAGFPHLEELRCTYSQGNAMTYNMNNRVLIRLLHTATNLTLLDLRGCYEINPWVSIYPGGGPSPIAALKELYLGRSSIRVYCEWLRAALLQWGHSLTVLDLSGIVAPASKLEEAFSSLQQIPHCPLARLNLSCSSVTPSCVLIILDSARDLKSLDLTSCRSIPRDLRGLHKGTSALTRLRARLQPGCPDSDTEGYESDDNDITEWPGTRTRRMKRKRRKPSRYQS